MNSKSFLSVTTVLSLCASFVVADSDISELKDPSLDLIGYNSRNGQSDNCPKKKKKDPCAKEPEKPRMNLPPREVCPPAGPRLREAGALDLGISFIYWQTQLTASDYSAGGFLGPTPSIALGDKLPRGKVDDLHWSFEPGFKAKIGWMFPGNYWELFVEYTYRYQDPEKSHAKASNHNTNPRGTEGVSSPTITAGDGFAGLSPNFLRASSKWSQHFNALDWMLVTNFYITRTLSVQPMVGIKTADIITNIMYEYDEVNFPAAQGAFDGSSYSIKSHEEQMGIGPRIGAQLLWNFNRNWGLFGKLVFSLPWTYFKDTRVEKIDTTGSATPAMTAKVHNVGRKEHQFQVIQEWELGLSYQAWFYQEKYQFFLQVAWELQNWGITRLMSSSGTPGDIGGLQMHGLTINTGFAF